ncbi:hypothetical protein BGZ99_008830 [Dissophora globulifera]|uniref:Uncharacterized protein n=1 Tax=Dissophora globulifera TaxID=979702 RepID=A0A9P6UP69_9FUNG|nr:hypothetical protein BGZ99_008830 [Dissophora globulifera]
MQGLSTDGATVTGGRDTFSIPPQARATANISPFNGNIGSVATTQHGHYHTAEQYGPTELQASGPPNHDYEAEDPTSAIPLRGGGRHVDRTYDDRNINDLPSSDLMSRWTSPNSYSTSTVKSDRPSVLFKKTLSTVFTFFLMIYVTGAGIHTAAAFFKNTIALFLDNHSQNIALSDHPLTTGDGTLSLELAIELKQGYLLMQDVWEHNISHYLYAFGAVGMSWCEMIAYAQQTLPADTSLDGVRSNTWGGDGERTDGSNKLLVVLWVLTGVLYGAIVGGVTCQYPKGLYVGTPYAVLMFFIIWFYIYRRAHGGRGLFLVGRFYILQTYSIGFAVAIAGIIAYMAVHKFDGLTSNDKSHLGNQRQY